MIDNKESSSNNIDQQIQNRQQRDGKIPLTVWQIGIMMMLMNISFVMAYAFSGL